MMEDYIQFSAKTKSEAITKACIELGTSSDQLEIQVITEGSSGFFGIGSKPAVIKVRKKEEVSEEIEIEKMVDSVKMDSIKEEKKKEVPKQAPAPKAERVKEPKETKEIREPKEKPQKPIKEKPQKERPVKEKPAKENKEQKEKAPKEKTVKEKPVKEKPAKASKPVEIITDPAEIKEIEERAVVFLRDVFGSMDLGEVEITSRYNTADGCLEVDFEGEDMGILIHG